MAGFKRERTRRARARGLEGLTCAQPRSPGIAEEPRRSVDARELPGLYYYYFIRQAGRQIDTRDTIYIDTSHTHGLMDGAYMRTCKYAEGFYLLSDTLE